jgi:hypothetical protein
MGRVAISETTCFVTKCLYTFRQDSMAKGGHGLPVVSPGPTMSYPSTPCGRVTPETAIDPSSTPLNTPHITPMQYAYRLHYSTLQMVYRSMTSIFLNFKVTLHWERWSHDQADAEWIVIRTQLRGHNDTPFERPASGRPSGRPGSGRPLGVFFMF